ncbi:MAG: dTDP-6-deoxy-L-hexose 3-O-methyltransferase [Kiloniella sp.]|nr:dTDP-6-deoxy-L-hexose 3-O-methyltransferase [Kiloniella sp.]
MTQESNRNFTRDSHLVSPADGGSAPTTAMPPPFALTAKRRDMLAFITRYELFKLIADRPGVIIELGVQHGQGLMSFAHIVSNVEPNHVARRIYGFDTFEGFPAVDGVDKASGGRNARPGRLKSNLARLKQAIKDHDQDRFLGQVPRVELVAGDVEQTLPAFIQANPQLLVALVYVDLCLYRPTTAALQALWPLMPKGSVMAFDQLAFPEFPGETRAVLEVIGADALDLRRFNFESQVSYLVR